MVQQGLQARSPSKESKQEVQPKCRVAESRLPVTVEAGPVHDVCVWSDGGVSYRTDCMPFGLERLSRLNLEEVGPVERLFAPMLAE